MTTVSEDDPEGDLLAAVRQIIGPRIPVVATLDMHAHVTRQMVRESSALVAFTHYPHDDSFSTGERAAALLFRVLRYPVKPVMALAKVPVLVGGVNGMTFGDAPMAHLTRRARQFEEQPGVLSASVFQVHAYNDLPMLGSGGLVITDNGLDQARQLAGELAQEFWTRRYEFECELMAVGEAIDRGRRIRGGPVLLIDTADCTGGGAAGDSIALLREMLKIGVSESTLLSVVDPEAAQTCFREGPGKAVRLELGHKLDSRWGEPLEARGVVDRLLEGTFVYTGGIYGGTQASMGPSAVLRIGAFQVLVMSKPTYEWRNEQFEAASLDVREAKFIGVKNPMNFNFAYEGISKGALVVDTPGPTPASVRHLPYRRMKRPFFPLDREIPGLQPDLFLGGHLIA
jgi:microcystin degradation protein MlrC